MKITILGTGTSQGVPVIGCDCEACLSDNPKDNRLRTSALLTHNNTNILIDAGPDLRQQLLRCRLHTLDAVLITHEHNDHIIGLDELRPFNFRQGAKMPIYTSLCLGGSTNKFICRYYVLKCRILFTSPMPNMWMILLWKISKVLNF